MQSTDITLSSEIVYNLNVRTYFFDNSGLNSSMSKVERQDCFSLKGDYHNGKDQIIKGLCLDFTESRVTCLHLET